MKKNDEITIDFAKEFTTHPYGRINKKRGNSGPEFREKLVKWLNEYEAVHINLSGTTNYTSSFLDEAFGGLIRKEGFSYNNLKTRLTVSHDMLLSVVTEIDTYMKEAEQAK